MAGTITALQVQKRNKERVNVYIDGQYALAVTMHVAAGLRKDQFLSDAEIEQLKQQDARDKAYHRAIYYLGFRARSRAEIEKYLRDKDYSPDVIGETIERLAKENYLDDQEFARAWVADRQRFKPRSRRALRYELRQKGVANADIEQALVDLPEEDMAHQALAKKIRQWQRLPEADFKKKAMGYLSRRGFSYAVARQTTEQAWDSLDAAGGSSF